MVILRNPDYGYFSFVVIHSNWTIIKHSDDFGILTTYLIAAFKKWDFHFIMQIHNRVVEKNQWLRSPRFNYRWTLEKKVWKVHRTIEKLILLSFMTAQRDFNLKLSISIFEELNLTKFSLLSLHGRISSEKCYMNSIKSFLEICATKKLSNRT